MSEILVGGKTGRSQRAPIDSEPVQLWVVLAGVGLAITFVGWADLALLWYPLHLGNPAWEFGTISAHFDGMPLATVGLALVISGTVARGWRRTARALSVFCVLIVLLLALSVLYLLSVPPAWRVTAPQARPLLMKAVLKAAAFAMTYIVLYAWVGRFLWRHTRLVKTSSSGAAQPQ